MFELICGLFVLRRFAPLMDTRIFTSAGFLNVIENRSRLIEGLLQSWRKQQEKQAMVEACLLLDELSNDEEAAWQQAAIIDWEVSG